MNIVKKCDFCNKQAVVDGKTRMGPWAYMCVRIIFKSMVILQVS